MKTDLATRADIDVLMRRFYSRAVRDELIGPIFTDVAQLDLEHHLPIIGDFWETLLFGTGNYPRHGHNPLQIHAVLHQKSPLSSQHFERWLELFSSAVDETFAGKNAEFLKTRAAMIAQRMHSYVDGTLLWATR